MGERESYAPGTFCWADLGTTDVEAATAFYGDVFGWEADGSRFRLAAVADPTGAAVELWQPRELAGAGRVNDAGYMCWNELASPDPGRAREF